MMSQHGKQTIAIQILPNISRSKDNHTMELGQLIKYNIFLKNHTQNVVQKLVPDPFLKTTKLSISLDYQSQVLYSLFLLHA